jgi:hypothetical protein
LNAGCRSRCAAPAAARTGAARPALP